MEQPSQSFMVFLHGNTARQTRGSHDFTWIIDNQLIQNLKGVNVALKWIQIPNARPPIDWFNNRYRIDDGTTTHDFTLPTANYTGAQLASEIEEDLKTLDSGYSVDFDTQTQRLAITIPDTADLRFAPTDRDCYKELGVTDLVNYYTDTILEFGEEVYLLGPTNIELHSSLASNNYSTRVSRDVLSIIPVETGYGTLIQYYNQGEDDFMWVTSSQFHSVQMTLFDTLGRPFGVRPDLLEEMIICLKVRPVHREEKPHAVLGDAVPGSLYSTPQNRFRTH